MLLAGANSIFYGDTLLTTSNNQMVKDKELISEFRDKTKAALLNFLQKDNTSIKIIKIGLYFAQKHCS